MLRSFVLHPGISMLHSRFFDAQNDCLIQIDDILLGFSRLGLPPPPNPKDLLDYCMNSVKLPRKKKKSNAIKQAGSEYEAGSWPWNHDAFGEEEILRT